MSIKILVIGGSAAGPKAAARARRMDGDAQITIIQKEPDLSMASCGYPYYVGGFFDDRNELIATPTGVVRDSKFFLNAKGIKAHVRTEAVSIDRSAKKVLCRNLETEEEWLEEYDKLIIATGAVPKIPPVEGRDLEGITTLQSMRDADYLRKIRDEGKIKKAVVIGGGLIGVETVEALHLAGIEITLIELSPQILMFLDFQLAKVLENHVKSKGVNVATNIGLQSFVGENGKLTAVKLSNGTEIPCELAVVAIGVAPNVSLARDAGIDIGEAGGIAVDENMCTNDPDIYAVGDCIEIPQLVNGKKVLAPYGDLANIQGRVAGENAVCGNTRVFKGTIQTGICKVFDFSVGTTGLDASSAKKCGIDAESMIIAGLDKPKFMGAKLLISKMTAERKSGRIIGFQCLGPADASKEIAEAAIAIQGGLKLDDISQADLPYAPPYSLALDHFLTASHSLDNKIRGLVKGVSAEYVKNRAESDDPPFILDVRGPDEYEEMRLGIGETLIPLGMLRGRLEELPKDKEKEIIAYCKISLRGYEASRLLNANGWTNVKILEGGIMAWPYCRDK